MNIIFSDIFLYFINDFKFYMYGIFIQTCSFQLVIHAFRKLFIHYSVVSLFQLELIFPLDVGYF